MASLQAQGREKRAQEVLATSLHAPAVDASLVEGMVGAGTRDCSRQTQGEDLVCTQRQSQGPQEWARPPECDQDQSEPTCHCTCEGSGPAPRAASSAARSQRVQLHLDKLWAHTSTWGWPTRRVGLKPELIPGGGVTFIDDSRRWQLPGHSTGRTCELTSGSFAEGDRGQLQRQCAS